MARRRKMGQKESAGGAVNETPEQREAPRPEGDGPVERHARSRQSLDQFSAPARRVLLLAEDEARRHNHAEVRPEHLLLAMLAEGRTTGAWAMARVGVVEPDDLRQALEGRLGRGAAPVEGPLTLGDGSKRILQFAVEDARRQGHPQVDTGHLLLGLVSDGSALQGEMLTALALRGLRIGVIGTRSWGGFRSPESGGALPRITPSGTRDNVVTLRIGDDDLAAVDALVEVGITRTRSEGAAWLLHAGIAANHSLFERAQGIVDEIRRLREEAQQLAQEHAAASAEQSEQADESAEQSAGQSERIVASSA